MPTSRSARSAAPTQQSQQTPPRTCIRLSPEDLSFMAAGGRHHDVSDKLKSLVRDWRTLFGLPMPIRKQLEADQRAQGIEHPRDYFVWLLMERHTALREPAANAKKGG